MKETDCGVRSESADGHGQSHEPNVVRRNNAIVYSEHAAPSALKM
jgi:hypothetical protein